MINPLLREKGRVQKGRSEAKDFGFPTANILSDQKNLAGTYAGEVIVRGKVYRAAIYADPGRGLLEAYLFDFSGDLYGQEVEMSLFKLVEPAILYTPETDIENFIRGAIRKAQNYFETP